jgi:hypothetical protein
MTILGKTLAIFVFLLSLIWCGLVITGHVTRVNWKTEADTYRKKAQEAAAAAAEWKAELEKFKAASAGDLNAKTAEIAKLNTQVANLEKSLSGLQTNFQAKLTNEQKLTSNTELAQANLVAAGKQNDMLFDARAKTETERDTALRAQKAAEASELQAKLESEAIKKQNESFQNKVIELSQSLKDLKSGANKPGAVRVVPVPEDIRGTVSKVSGEYIQINLGADASLAEGAVLDVVRYGDKPMYLGTITLVQVSTKDAVGQFTKKGEVAPKAGDSVIKLKN